LIIDLHIHSKCSDGIFSVEELIREAKARNVGFMSITDHDSIEAQAQAMTLAKEAGIYYMSGVELNVNFSHPSYVGGKPVTLDFLGYQFDINNESLKGKLETMAKYRRERAAKILANLNAEFDKEGIKNLTMNDLKAIEATVEGSLGRPHIADYLVKKGIVQTRQEAFDKYLIKCDVPKYPFYLSEASKLIHDAGGVLVLAHPNDSTISLGQLSKSLDEQIRIIREVIKPYIDGVECWHPSNDSQATNYYVRFAEEQGLIMTGGSDCHQSPIVMGTVSVPDFVFGQFRV
jgi:3',5'-nucleoside bisphosphate phosphatase